MGLWAYGLTGPSGNGLGGIVGVDRTDWTGLGRRGGPIAPQSREPQTHPLIAEQI